MNVLKNGESCISPDKEHDPHYEPIIFLPEVIVNTMEDDEAVMFQQRAKLFRHDKIENEWKERGTGEAKLLYNENLNTVRVLMRRDKTLKICANHYVTKDMELKPNCGSDRAWIWTTGADVSDGEPHSEVLAMKFINADAANKWKDKFEEAKSLIVKGTPNQTKTSDCSSESDISSEEEQVVDDENEERTDSKNQKEENLLANENINTSTESIGKQKEENSDFCEKIKTLNINDGQPKEENPTPDCVQ